MKQDIDLFVTEIAHRVANNHCIKRCIQPFYSLYKQLIRNKRNKVFRENGLEALIQFDKCMQKNGLFYTLAFGTMLGAIREHGFIKHDLDIDVSMFIEDYSEKLESFLLEFGFILQHSFLVEGGTLGREETYLYKGVSIDIFFFYPPINQLPYCCDFQMYNDSSTFRESMKKYGRVLPRRIELPMTKERKIISFEGVPLFVPQNAEEILSFRYGEDYMVPNPQWEVNSHDLHIVEWKDKLGLFVDYS